MIRNLFIIALFLPLISFGQVGGAASFAALELQMSPRLAALGGAPIGVRDGDLNLGLYNPALLDSAAHQRLALGYMNYFAGSNTGYAGYAYTLPSDLTLAASVQYISYGDLNWTSADGLPLGTFNASDFVAQVSAGYALDSALSVGVTGKFIYSSIAQYISTGAALDIAGSYRNPAKRFTAHVILRNFGVQLRQYNDDIREELPMNLSAGFTKRFRHAPFRFSVVAEHLEQWDLTYDDPNANAVVDPITGEVIGQQRWEFGDKLMRHVVFGTEFLLSESFQVRLGYHYRRRQETKVTDKPGLAGFSWGFGFRVKKFDISYARATYHISANTNQFSIATRLSNW